MASMGEAVNEDIGPTHIGKHYSTRINCQKKVLNGTKYTGFCVSFMAVVHFQKTLMISSEPLFQNETLSLYL